MRTLTKILTALIDRGCAVDNPSEDRLYLKLERAYILQQSKMTAIPLGLALEEKEELELQCLLSELKIT